MIDNEVLLNSVSIGENGSIIDGIPTMVLIPSFLYRFKVLKDMHKIVVPRRSTYKKLAPFLCNDEDGSYDLLDEESKVMDISSITRVLFAVKKYPKLKRHQLFAPKRLIFDEDNLTIVGQIIEMLSTGTEIKKDS